MRFVFLALVFLSVAKAEAKCGRDAKAQALEAIQFVLENQARLIPESAPLDLGAPVSGTGGSLLNRTHFSALQMYTKGSASGFFECRSDGQLVLKMISFGTQDGQLKQKTLSFE